MSLKVFLLLIFFLPLFAFAKDKPEIVIPQTTAPVKYFPLAFEKALDGATFKASGQVIRIWGIDAPEEKEPFYKESMMALKLFLEDKTLECKPIDKDAVHGDIRHCSVNGQDLGALMVKTGWAKDYPKLSEGFYKADEEFAKEGKLGLWE